MHHIIPAIFIDAGPRGVFEFQRKILLLTEECIFLPPLTKNRQSVHFYWCASI